MPSVSWRAPISSTPTAKGRPCSERGSEYLPGKALLLPEGGDVRSPRRNDQAGRVMLLFEGMRAILYVWDTTAPIGAEARSDSLDLFQRVLIVVRSGPQGIGEWQREKRDVYRDYRRLLEEEPTPIKWVRFESHSDDVRSQSPVLFGL